MENKTGTTFRELAMKVEENNFKNNVKKLLESDFVKRTNSGYEIDVLKVCEHLTKKQKESLAKHLLASIL